MGKLWRILLFLSWKKLFDFLFLSASGMIKREPLFKISCVLFVHFVEKYLRYNSSIPQKRIFYIERRTQYIFCIDFCLITLLKKKPIVSTTKKQIQFKLLSVILPRRRLKLRRKKLHDKLLRNPNPVSDDRNKLAKNPKRKKKRENKKL